MDISELAAQVAEKMGMRVAIYPDRYSGGTPTFVDDDNEVYDVSDRRIQQALAYRALKEMVEHTRMYMSGNLGYTFHDRDIRRMVYGGTEAIFQAYLKWER